MIAGIAAIVILFICILVSSFYIIFSQKKKVEKKAREDLSCTKTEEKNTKKEIELSSAFLY